MFHSPLEERLKNKRSILIAGAGGGFDIFSGLPLYFALRGRGQKVHLANLTFTALEVVCQTTSPLQGLCRVDSESRSPHYYFPEAQLARWHKAKYGDDLVVWCFEKTGVRPLAEKYRYLVEELGLDAIVLVDGGVDSLLRGDEKRLGTPSEDAASLAAVGGLPLDTKILACLALGAEIADEIDHGQVLENIAALTKDGAFLGGVTLSKDMPEVQAFIEAGRHALDHTHPRGSVIVASLLSALDGEFGDHHRLERTRGNTLWINPLMPIYWFFDLPAVIRRNLYLPHIMNTTSIHEVSEIIWSFHRSSPRRDGGSIPI
jgi:hypothetical protein